MTTTASPRLDYVCQHCGAGGATRDAWAEWDIDAQDWQLSEIFDFAFCHHCHRETRLVPVPVSAHDDKH